MKAFAIALVLVVASFFAAEAQAQQPRCDHRGHGHRPNITIGLNVGFGGYNYGYAPYNPYYRPYPVYGYGYGGYYPPMYYRNPYAGWGGWTQIGGYVFPN